MLITNILDQIRRDVASFADPGTEVQITERVLSWTRSRTPFSAQLIRRSTGFPDVLWGGRELSYTGFLASEALADLKDLATTISSLAIPPPNYVPVYARTEGASPGASAVAEAAELIVKQTVDPSSLPMAATRVLFVHGNAGTGKTSTLIHVTRLQAERYLQGQTGTLLLYLDAQGKGLSQLEDVMARALQDIRAKFTYHSVAALTRRHCVIPIVDGFDELIGPSSAREAFANLSQFLAQLDCEGALVASSRSGFIDYRTLYERAAELAAAQNLSYEIVPVEVLPWEDSAIVRYCDERTPGSTTLKTRVFSLLSSPARDLLRKPFFLAKISDIFEEGGNVDVGGDITRQVVDAALAREASKLKDERGRELLSLEQHRVFCETLADEMWSLGAPELDTETVRLLAEVVAGEFGLSPRDAKTLIDRSVAHGLLTVVTGRGPEKRSFEHELFRFEFQSGTLAKLLLRGPAATRDYIQRAELPLEIVSRVQFYGVAGIDVLVQTIDSLNKVVAAAPNNAYASTNAGSLASALIHNRQDVPAGLRLQGFYLRSQDLGICRLKSVEIRRCLFERVNLQHVQLLGSSVDDTQFIGCSVGPDTRFTGTRVDVAQFVGIVDPRTGREVYAPGEIARRLRSAGAILPDAADDENGEELTEEVQLRVDVLERLLTHARTHFYLSREESWFQNNLRRDPAWIFVEQLLRRHKLLEDVRLTKSGRPETFLRLTTAPDKILQARADGANTIPRNAAQFWRDLLAA